MVIRINKRKGNEWFSSTDVSEGHRVRNQRDLAQNRQRANLGDIEETLYTAARKEVLIYQIQKVIPPHGDSKQVAFLQVDRE